MYKYGEPGSEDRVTYQLDECLVHILLMEDDITYGLMINNKNY